MKKRHVKLNFLVSVLLIVILVIAFCLLFSCAITGINKYYKVSYGKFLQDTKDSSDGIFVVDIEQQASMAGEIFYTASNIAKLIAFHIFDEKSDKSNLQNNFNLKLDSKKNVYYSLENGKEKAKDKSIYGTLVICNADQYKEDTEYVDKYLKLFSQAEEMLKQVCFDNIMFTDAWILNPKGMLIDVSPNSSELYNMLNKDKFKELDAVLNYFKKEKEKCAFSKVYKNESGEYIISIMYPKYNGKELSAVVGINLKYSYILEALYSGVLRKYYEKYNVIRLFLDDEGFLMFYPREYMELLSLPENDVSLILEKDNLYNANLNLSKNPAVKALAKKLVDNQEGKEKVKLDGNEYLVSFKTLPVNNWTMAVMISTEDLYKDLYELESSLKNVKQHIYIRFTAIFIFIAFLCLLVSIFVFKRQIVKPIEELCRKIKLLGKGNFNIKFKEEGIHEIYDLSKTFNELGAELNDYIKKFEEEVSIRHSVEKEINLARRIQESIIPSLGKEFDQELFLIKSKLEPAKNVSGDFYDVFYINKNKIAFIVADVSGKGFPAAFFMAIARTAIRNICMLGPLSPGEVFKQASKTLCENNKASMFVTAFLGFYEIDTGKLSYSNAGHLPPIIYSEKNMELNELETICDPPLGCIDDFEFSSFEKTLQKDEVLILFTDGVVEAESESKELFGIERLKEFINSNISLSGEDFLNKLFSLLFEFQNDKIADDITAFFLKRRK